MANFSDNRNVRIGRTTNRQLGFLTPSASDTKCPYFADRFVRHGVATKENRAICEKANDGVICDYQKNYQGIPMCLRYWYGPRYEIVDEIEEPYVQKRNNAGQVLFFESDGVTETTVNTGHPIYVLHSVDRPLDYVSPDNPQFYSTQYEDTHEKIFGINNNVLGWHKDV